jgi:glycerol-3-phosphate cytidylyltransferase-like family protein
LSFHSDAAGWSGDLQVLRLQALPLAKVVGTPGLPQDWGITGLLSGTFRLKGDDRPINGIGERMTVLSVLAAVDWVVPFAEDTPERLICTVLPDVLVKGGDYRPEEIAGGQCVLENGGEVKVLSFRDGCSTSDILDRVRGRAGKDR